MTREEEIKQNGRKYTEPLADGLYFGDSPMTKVRVHAFIKGAEWADQHPKEGLWDAEKVCNILRNKMDSNWFYENIERANYDSIIEDLRKAMEK